MPLAMLSGHCDACYEELCLWIKHFIMEGVVVKLGRKWAMQTTGNSISNLLFPTPHAGAEPERVIREIEEIIGLDCSNIIRASAKMGLGIDETLEAIVTRIPPPKNNVPVSGRMWRGGQLYASRRSWH